MSEPVIPSLVLAPDNSAMSTNSRDTYGLHLEVDAPEAWVYVPAGRFPDYTPQIVVSALADNTAAALCASSTAAGQINVKLPARASLSAAGFDTASKTYSWTISITSDDPATVVIGPQTPLAFDLTNIRPNNIPGIAKITLTPRMKANQAGKTDIGGPPLVYTVEKSVPPLVIEDVKWSLGTRAGKGLLSWTVTGDVLDCVVRANDEQIGYPIADGTEYSASLILQSGPQALTITAADANGNTATYSENKDFSDFNPYFRLQVSNGRPLSLVSSDQTAILYGVFQKQEEDPFIWQNDLSGTQDNWQATGIALPGGAATSPCVFYGGSFYLAGGSAFDPGSFGSAFWVYADNKWQPIQGPDAWSEPRIGQAVALFDEAIWVAGGYGASGAVYDDVFCYTRDASGGGRWTAKLSLPEPRCNASLASVGERLYLYGGYTDMPGGTAKSDLCLFTDTGWADQHKTPPAKKKPDYWCLGSLNDALLLLASFGGRAFTLRMTSKPNWQGDDSNLSNVAITPDAQPPYGFTTVLFKHRLFLVMGDTTGNSAFAYYEPPSSHGRAIREA
jgi:hypothetical protein